MRCVTFLRWAFRFFVQFLSMSSIHGVNHLAARKRHPVEIVLWMLLITVGLYGALTLSGLTLNRYSENPTVISMERDRFSWNTSFPAATICPSAKLDDELLDEYVKKSNATDKTALKNFLLSLANASYYNFDLVTNYNEVNPDDYLKLVNELKFKFKPSVSNSGVNGIEYSLQKIVTEMGICYTLYSQLGIYNTLEYWQGNRWGLEKLEETYYVNPLDGEVFANVVNMSTGFNMYLHGPFEVADVSSKKLHSPNGYFLQVYLTAISIYSSERAASLTINQRKCRFYKESNLKHSPVYSFVLCRMECRIRLANELCGCIPYFYRKLDGEKICDVKGMHCLAEHKERLETLKQSCTCYPNCDDTNYLVVQVDAREWFLGSNLQWGLKEYPRMRLKRDVIFGFTDLLVYIGGMAGLFFGCSILSFVEIFYYYTLRLFWFVMAYKRRMKKVIQVKERKY